MSIGSIKNDNLRRAAIVVSMPVMVPLAIVVGAIAGARDVTVEMLDASRSAWVRWHP